MVLYKLVVLGDGGVGKTALTIQLCLQHFVETVSIALFPHYKEQNRRGRRRRLSSIPSSPLLTHSLD